MGSLIRDDAWLERAACSGVGWEPFFDSQDLEPALSLCRRCPVRLECLRFAIGTGLESGVWGGLSPEGRRRVRYSELVA
jgi:WhiB family transcriptional regulator, redox-sensing transcriptional regulator